MKKTLIIIAILIAISVLFKSNQIIIPKEAIRFRVIANSNSNKDQFLKKEIVKNLQKDIRELELVPKNIDLTRKAIKEALPKFETTINNTLIQENEQTKYSIDYGLNYFPEKEYKGIKYEAGEYESVVIKLGDATGDNFWCVLFPPLCLLDTETANSDEFEYTSFIKELLDKYF